MPRTILHLANTDGVSTGDVVVLDGRTLDDAREEAIGRVAEQYDGLIAIGRFVTVQGAQKLYQIDDGSLQKIAGAAADAVAVVAGVPGAAWDPGFYWIAADNTQQPMAAADCFAFGQNIKSYVTALVYTGRALKDQILVLTTNDACDAFDVTQGWPSNP